jgi:hypothetical protein
VLPVRLGRDVVDLATAPLEWDRTDWRKLGLGVAVVGAVSLLDEKVHDLHHHNPSGGATSVAQALRPLGKEGGLVVLGAAWLGGRTLDRPALVAVAEDGLEATIIAAGLITPLMKTAFGRTRPNQTVEVGSFWGSGASFPSGEATQAFAIASVVSAHSDSGWVKAAAWGTAGLLGLGRIQLDGHWASDVVAGALIGATVGSWVVRRNRPERSGGAQLTVTPLLATDEYGIAMRISF